MKTGIKVSSVGQTNFTSCGYNKSNDKNEKIMNLTSKGNESTEDTFAKFSGLGTVHQLIRRQV